MVPSKSYVSRMAGDEPRLYRYRLHDFSVMQARALARHLPSTDSGSRNVYLDALRPTLWRKRHIFLFEDDLFDQIDILRTYCRISDVLSRDFSAISQILTLYCIMRKKWSTKLH